MTSDMLQGYATEDATLAYEDRFPELDPAHFRDIGGLRASSIGIGTYLGDADAATDQSYKDAISAAVSLGCNFIDTAVNYRFQRSERTIGTALRHLRDNGFNREELIICTKGGFFSFDGSYPADPRAWVRDNFITPGVINPDDIAAGSHCMSPAYLSHQINESRKNLGLETLDIYYIHNPETQLDELNENEFYGRLESAFAALEQAVAKGFIRNYGTATWDGYTATRESGRLLQLEKVLEQAVKAGGPGHHFKFIQLPVNLVMPEAFSRVNQTVQKSQLTILEAARSLNVNVIASASLLQARLTRDLPATVRQAIAELPDDASRALQFVRSAPSVAVALVGMSQTTHVKQNMELAHLAPLSPHDFDVFFGNR
jgi:aryl-alcohol dehydrogenase-like predicted oxidoreductase